MAHELNVIILLSRGPTYEYGFILQWNHRLHVKMIRVNPDDTYVGTIWVQAISSILQVGDQVFTTSLEINLDKESKSQ